MKPTALLVMLFTATPAFAQTAADSAAIRATALDYIEGFYEANPERMERALHPDLAKRIVRTRAGESMVANMDADRLVEITRDRGAPTPKSERRADVEITHVFGNAATVRLDASDWVDFLQIGKVDDRWVIINVLWEMRPK